jgi:molybdopterin-biosynthesis enzyme MoeA-like protein
MIRQDSQAILFSFGGIGSTPDDLTRAIAAKVFTNLPLKRHEKFEQDIIQRFGDEAYPHRIHMSDLPENASLLFNPVNNMSGFALFDKYFFVPGFPEMAHPMIAWAIKEHFFSSSKKLRLTLLAHTSENTLIDIMKKIPKELEFSSLPMFRDSKAMVEISLSGENRDSVITNFRLFEEYLTKEKINYNLI